MSKLKHKNGRLYGLLLLSLLGLTFSTCQQEAPLDAAQLATFSQLKQVHWNKVLTDVMVADIFTPPVCSRIYAYPNVAAYEVFAASSEEHPSLVGNLQDLTEVPAPKAGEVYYFPLSSMVAFATVARPLVYSMEKIDTAEQKYFVSIQEAGIPASVFDRSVAYGRQVGQHILDWANQDGYLERTALSQYVLQEKPGAWKPTPPDYMPAIEPNWNTLRTFVLDSVQQFPPLPPTTFATDEQSKFYRESMEVYTSTNNLNEERIAVAKFWDCNPNVSHTKGHLTFFDQKISPGGHWMSIAGIAIEKRNLSLQETAQVFALTSITLADAFISCWDEKYRSSLIRPETYINQYIDPDWEPILQTPAFPEYTSGHSVISSAAAVMLTDLLGDGFAFTDSTEVKYGLPMRQFDSFFAASEEAAISRLYGGIHYMPAIENGVSQGKKIGRFVSDKLEKYRTIK
ncbi:MAG: vanadium-dependent haloperoxidase [Bacteroidota bacterium]